MNNPTDGNVIGSIGIKTVDNNGSCVNASISHQSDMSCSLTVNGVSRTRYDEEAGVVMTIDGGHVHVRVANCEKEEVVMWVTCRLVDGQRMINLMFSRGANLRQTSHGLLGMKYQKIGITNFINFLTNIILSYAIPKSLCIVVVVTLI